MVNGLFVYYVLTFSYIIYQASRRPAKNNTKAPSIRRSASIHQYSCSTRGCSHDEDITVEANKDPFVSIKIQSTNSNHHKERIRHLGLSRTFRTQLARHERRQEISWRARRCTSLTIHAPKSSFFQGGKSQALGKQGTASVARKRAVDVD